MVATTQEGFSSKTPLPVPTAAAATYETVGFNKKESTTIEFDQSNSAYGTGRHWDIGKHQVSY